MSGASDRRRDRTQRRVAEALEAERVHNRRLEDEMARLANQLQAMKDWWRLYGAVPRPGQPYDTFIEEQERRFTRGSAVLDLKLEAGDIAIAERLAKQTGRPLDACIKAISQVNIMNTPSYEGGTLIRKGDAKLKPKKLKKLAKQRQAERLKQATRAGQTVLAHKMTGADPETDRAVFKALYLASHTPIGQRPGQPVSSALGLLTARR
jgi:hypothetical protein